MASDERKRVPLPEPLPTASADGAGALRAGCWIVEYQEHSGVTYDGTIRVEANPNGLIVSGDLYNRSANEPNPADGIPIFSRSDYAYYLPVTKIVEGSETTLGFEMWQLNLSSRSWSLHGAFEVVLSAVSSDTLQGDVTGGEAVVGSLKMVWVSSMFRKATVEIDTVRGGTRPLQSGHGLDWATVFDAVGWEVTLWPKSNVDVTQPGGRTSWADAEMHAAMLKWRDLNDLDTVWRYHILVVKGIKSTPRGIMYDAGATDSDKVPREGVGIATDWKVDSGWGLASGKRFADATEAYFRTAIHELGHALGLYHNTIDFGFMNTSDVIAEAGNNGKVKFPNNIKWAFADDDLHRLRHYPDVFVRPGGVPFGEASVVGDSQTTAPEGLTLEVEANLSEVPLGAPVRVDVTLSNESEEPITVPASLSLKAGFVRGTVTGADGVSRSFSPLMLVDDHPMVELQQGESVTGSLTLMRGGEGALFPVSGDAEIAVEVHWEGEDGVLGLVGTTTVSVTEPETDSHASAAKKILSTPDAHLVLVVGGDHLEEGLEAIQAALDDDTLRPHFAAIVAKRLAQPFEDRLADLDSARDFLQDCVASVSEVTKLQKLVTALTE